MTKEGRGCDGLSSGGWRSCGWLLAAVTALLVLGACGAAEATATPIAPAATPTPTPQPPPTVGPLFADIDVAALTQLVPTPTPTVERDLAEPVVYVLDKFTSRDCGYEFRMGETTAWGYSVGDRISGLDGDGIVITVRVGDTLQMRRIDNPARTCERPMTVFNEELGINYTLQPDEQIEPFVINLTKVGTFVIDNPAEPGSHGKFVIEVLARGLEPVVYVLDKFTSRDCGYEFRMGETTAWGYSAGDRISGLDGDGIVITVHVGDTLQMRRIDNPARTCERPMTVVNEELGINYTLQPDEQIEPFVINLTKAGTFVIDNPAEPGSHGKFVIEVEG